MTWKGLTPKNAMVALGCKLLNKMCLRILERDMVAFINNGINCEANLKVLYIVWLKNLFKNVYFVPTCREQYPRSSFRNQNSKNVSNFY